MPSGAGPRPHHFDPSGAGPTASSILRASANHRQRPAAEAEPQAAQAARWDSGSRRQRGAGPLSPRCPGHDIRAPLVASSATTRRSARLKTGLRLSTSSSRTPRPGAPTRVTGASPRGDVRARPANFLRALWGPGCEELANQRGAAQIRPPAFWNGRGPGAWHGEGAEPVVSRGTCSLPSRTRAELLSCHGQTFGKFARLHALVEYGCLPFLCFESDCAFVTRYLLKLKAGYPNV